MKFLRPARKKPAQPEPCGQRLPNLFFPVGQGGCNIHRMLKRCDELLHRAEVGIEILVPSLRTPRIPASWRICR